MTKTEYQYLTDVIKRLPKGDVVVAGTYYGDDVLAIWEGDPERNIIVVDSFEGLAEPTEADICDGHMVAGECNINGIENFYKTFLDKGLEPPKETHKMWVSPKALSCIPQRPLALLFLDLDHYQPTKDCLEYFGSWVVSGGQILVHDYDFKRCPGIKKCCDEWNKGWTKVTDTGFGMYRL